MFIYRLRRITTLKILTEIRNLLYLYCGIDKIKKETRFTQLIYADISSLNCKLTNKKVQASIRQHLRTGLMDISMKHTK